MQDSGTEGGSGSTPYDTVAAEPRPSSWATWLMTVLAISCLLFVLCASEFISLGIKIVTERPVR